MQGEPAGTVAVAKRVSFSLRYICSKKTKNGGESRAPLGIAAAVGPRGSRCMQAEAAVVTSEKREEVFAFPFQDVALA